IELSLHCVGRFHQHFCPCMTTEQAGAELDRLISDHSELRFDRPGYLTPMGPTDDAVAYIEIQGTLIIPLVQSDRDRAILVAATCIAFGAITHAERRRRRARRQRRRRRTS